METDLEPIAEDWSRGMAVVAHPDDLEYGAVAAIARWTAMGKEIVYVLVTSGEAGINGMEPELTGELREREQRAAAAVVGVRTVEFLGHPDGMLEYGLPLRRDIARQIRRHRPETLITVNCRPTFDSGMVNQSDHIAVGQAMIDAARDAGNRWVFRELLAEGHEPWNGVKRVAIVGSPLARHGADVSKHVETGIASLAEHRTYLDGLGDEAVPWEDLTRFLRDRVRAVGVRLGCEYAVPFEVLNL